MKWPAAAVDRRTLLIGGVAGVGLIVAVAAWPRRAGSPLRAGKGERVFGPYLRIGSDGGVTVAVPQAETGQGSWTALAQIAANELGAAWEKVAVEPAPIAPGYANRVAGQIIGTATRLTGLSTSVRSFEAPLREAGAMARHLLCAAAAARWGVAVEQCDARDGMVSDGNRALAFAELVDEAALLHPPASVRLRGAGKGPLAGQSLARIELPAKADGSLRFAGDVRLPGLRFAAVRMAPPGGRLTGFDRAAAQVAGHVRLVVREEWIVAVAETSWAANRALGAANPQFRAPANSDSPAIEALLFGALAGPMRRTVGRGDYDEAVEGRRPLAATYTIAPAPHWSIEPSTVVVRLAAGRCELWAGTRAADLVAAAAAKALALRAEDVTLYPMPLGDGGGAAIDARLATIAVTAARELGAPLALTMPAASAQNHDEARPPMMARIAALPAGANGIAAWHGRFAGAAGIDAAVARAGGHEAPELSPRGAVPPYAAGAVRIEAASARLPIRSGYGRGDIEALTAFANESFIDELARARGVEPLAFRIGLLGGQPRLARVLSAAASRGGWDGGARGSAMGIACASAFGSHIGLLAEASIGPDQRIKVSRLVAAVDAGRLINPGLARQQIEGGLLHALASVTAAAPEVVAGMMRARGLKVMGLERGVTMPSITVLMVEGTGKSGGISDLAETVVAAAMANALYAATGLRLRRLPFDPMSA